MIKKRGQGINKGGSSHFRVARGTDNQKKCGNHGTQSIGKVSTRGAEAKTKKRIKAGLELNHGGVNVRVKNTTTVT